MYVFPICDDDGSSKCSYELTICRIIFLNLPSILASVGNLITNISPYVVTYSYLFAGHLYLRTIRQGS